MVSVPLCTKLEMSDRGNQGSPWASSIATLYHPPVGNEELRLSFLLAHCIANGEKEIGNPAWCLHFSLAVASWLFFPPFPLRKHCWSLVQVLESLLSIDHWHRPAKLRALRTSRVTHICQGHMSFAMFLLFLCLHIARNCDATCKSAWRYVKQEWKPPVERYT